MPTDQPLNIINTSNSNKPGIFKIVIIAESQSTEITGYVRKIQVIINDISLLLLLSRRGVLFKSSVRDFQAQEGRDTDIQDSNDNKESNGSHEDAYSNGLSQYEACQR